MRYRLRENNSLSATLRRVGPRKANRFTAAPHPYPVTDQPTPTNYLDFKSSRLLPYGRIKRNEEWNENLQQGFTDIDAKCKHIKRMK